MKKVFPFQDMIQISPGGEFILMNLEAVKLPQSEFKGLHNFIRFAFEHYETMHQLYPVDENANIRLTMEGC